MQRSVDFHGSTGFGQAFHDAINRNWGGWPLEDLQKGLAYVTAHDPQLQANNACALGGSYGGYMMNWIEGNWPDRFKCIVQHDGVFEPAPSPMRLRSCGSTNGSMAAPISRRLRNMSGGTCQLREEWKTPQLVITSENDFQSPTPRESPPSLPSSAATSRRVC